MKSSDQILVPTNYSAQSTIALEQSYNLARLTKSEITLLNVMEEDLLSPLVRLLSKRHQDGEFVKLIQKKVNDLAQKSARDAKVKINTLVMRGKVYEEIVKAAKTLKAKFIVMATSDSGSFIGSNTLRVVREAPCPVITIGGSVHRPGCKNIVLPLDLTKETNEKVSEAIEIAGYFGSAIRVVSLVDTDDEFIVNKLKRHLSQVKEFIKSKGVTCTGEMIKGHDVAKSIIDYAKKVKADLIMIMTQQEINFTQFFIGSAAQQIINHSDIPVLSIHPSGKEYSTSYSSTSLYS